MQRPIRILDRQLIDRIAAGEVVERPASIVKELIDNAIDAGADDIRVELDGGGVERIRVSDNGHGMDADDAAASILRYATSKLRTFDDLVDIRSYGFRGEALPSIAAVSRFALWTRRAADEVGTLVRVEQGDATVEPAACAPGTIVETCDLFANLPARRKFLKSTATETAHAIEVCTWLLLPHPHIRLQLLRNGRLARQFLPSATQAARVHEVWRELPLPLIEGQWQGLRVEAHLSAHGDARRGAHHVQTYVNGRWVRDRGLLRAIAFAYGERLPSGRYPIGAVFLQLDRSEVDVNAHPQKTEVRFADARGVWEGVSRILAAALPSLGDSTPRSYNLPSDAAAPSWRDRRSSYGAPPVQHDGSLPSATPLSPATPWRSLGQAAGRFVVCESQDGLLLLDQHAADRQCLLQCYRQQVEKRQVPQKNLLFPVRLPCTAEEGDWLDGNTALLAELGFAMQRLARDVVRIDAVPQVLQRAAVPQLLRTLLPLSKADEQEKEQPLVEAMQRMAAHAATQPGDRLATADCVSLLQAYAAIADIGRGAKERAIVARLPWPEAATRAGV